MMLGNDDISLSVKALEQETWEQKRHKGEQIIQTILLQADFFEMKTRVKPTIFMSYDLFALVAAVNRDALGREVLLHRIDKNQIPHTICGYDIEFIHPGTELLYVGYKVLF